VEQGDGGYPPFFSRDHGRGLLVIIDEAMSARTNDLAVLARVI